MSQELNFHCSYSDGELKIIIPCDENYNSEKILYKILIKHVTIPAIKTIEGLGYVCMFNNVEDYNTAKFICKRFRIEINYKIPN